MRRLLVALLLCLSGGAATQALPPEIAAAKKKKMKVGTTATASIASSVPVCALSGRPDPRCHEPRS